MALHPRNIALEGLAAEFLTPEGLAVLGFSDEAPAQVETGSGEVTNAVGGGGGWWRGGRGGWHSRPPIYAPIPEDEALAPITAQLVEAQPAQTDTLVGAVHVTALLSETGPAQTEAILCIATVRGEINEIAPAQTEAIDGAVRNAPIVPRPQAPPLHALTARINEANPSQTDDICGHIIIAGALIETAPAQTDDLAANVFRADPRMLSRARERLEWRLAERGRRAG